MQFSVEVARFGPDHISFELAAGADVVTIRRDARDVETIWKLGVTILVGYAILVANRRYGYRLREIADKAGIRSSTVYYYFASKERIYEEIIRIAETIKEAVRPELYIKIAIVILGGFFAVTAAGAVALESRYRTKRSS
mgnify:CR=1 FL=1